MKSIHTQLLRQPTKFCFDKFSFCDVRRCLKVAKYERVYLHYCPNPHFIVQQVFCLSKRDEIYLPLTFAYRNPETIRNIVFLRKYTIIIQITYLITYYSIQIELDHYFDFKFDQGRDRVNCNQNRLVIWQKSDRRYIFRYIIFL